MPSGLPGKCRFDGAHADNSLVRGRDWTLFRSHQYVVIMLTPAFRWYSCILLHTMIHPLASAQHPMLAVADPPSQSRRLGHLCYTRTHPATRQG